MLESPKINARLFGALAFTICSSVCSLGHAQMSEPPSDRVASDAIDDPSLFPPDWTRDPVNGTGISYHTFQSQIAQTAVSYHIYLPPSYDADPDRDFPVVYWLHGSGAGTDGILVYSDLVEQAVLNEDVPEMIVVFPFGIANRMWVDSADGYTRVESLIIDELIPLIDNQYQTIATREGRVIDGFSMGGYGAARLGFKHHELFAGISILAGGPLQLNLFDIDRPGKGTRIQLLEDVYGGSMDIFMAVSPWQMASENASELDPTTLVRVVLGGLDFSLPANDVFHAHLLKLGIAHEYTVIPGIGHNPAAVFSNLGDENWSFYRRAFGFE